MPHSSQWIPRKLLILTLEACAFGRRLTYKGAVSEEAYTLSAILAGSGFAVDLLLVTLIVGMDEIMKRKEPLAVGCTLRAFMIVDDIRIVVEGQPRQVSRGILKVTEAALSVLEQALLMEVSLGKDGMEGKSVAQASSAQLRKSITPGMNEEAWHKSQAKSEKSWS